MRLEVFLPVHTVSEANLREHWRAKHARSKKQKNDTFMVLLAKLGRVPPKPPLRITMERIGVKRLDVDNLAGSNKHTADSIAKWLGIDDGSPLLTWEYAQSKPVPGGPRFGVRVTIESVGTSTRVTSTGPSGRQATCADGPRLHASRT